MQEARRDRAAAKAEAEQARADAAAAREEQARANRELQRTQQVMVMQRAGVDNPQVHRLFRREYRDIVEEQGDEAPTFDDWFGSDEVQKSDIFKPFLNPTPATPQDQQPGAILPSQPTVQEPRGTQPPPNIDANTTPGGGGGAGEVVTESQVKQWSSDPQQWRRHGARARKALERKYGRSLGSAPRFKTDSE